MRVLKFSKREHFRSNVEVGDMIKFNMYDFEMLWCVIKVKKYIKAFCLNNGKIAKLLLNGPMESYSLIKPDV